MHRILPARLPYSALAFVTALTLTLSLAVQPTAAAPVPAVAVDPAGPPDPFGPASFGTDLAAPGAQPLDGLPLAFLPNAGQADPSVLFQAQGLGGSVGFTANELVVRLPSPAAGQPDQLDGLTAPDSASLPTDAPAADPAAAVPPAAPVDIHIQFDGANPAPEVV